VRRPWRVRRAQAGVHAARDAADAHLLRRLSAGFGPTPVSLTPVYATCDPYSSGGTYPSEE
jgi:hypothetical protein